jgi:hypothetical protein
MSRSTVQRTFRLTSRDRLLVTGALEGGPLRIGDLVMVQADSQTSARVVVRSIELHSAPGTTTVAMDLAWAELIRPGTVLVRPE